MNALELVPDMDYLLIIVSGASCRSGFSPISLPLLIQQNTKLGQENPHWMHSTYRTVCNLSALGLRPTEGDPITRLYP